MNELRFLDVDMTAKYLSLGKSTIWKFVRDGLIPTTKFGGATKFDKNDLDEFIAKCKTTPHIKTPKQKNLKLPTREHLTDIKQYKLDMETCLKHITMHSC